MEKKTLETYRIRNIRIKKLQMEVEELKNKELTTLKGTVKASSRQYPYIQGRTSVLIVDPEEKEHNERRIEKKEKEIQALREINREVENYIDEIEDSLEKTIIEMYYIDGERVYQKEIAAILDVPREEISKAISKHGI